MNRSLWNKLKCIVVPLVISCFLLSCKKDSSSSGETDKPVDCLCITSRILKTKISGKSKTEAEKSCDNIGGKIQNCS